MIMTLAFAVEILIYDDRDGNRRVRARSLTDNRIVGPVMLASAPVPNVLETVFPELLGVVNKK
jgi:N-acyl-L-homoserine lactone synthetase